jgi:hypothetical protein
MVQGFSEAEIEQLQQVMDKVSVNLWRLNGEFNRVSQPPS